MIIVLVKAVKMFFRHRTGHTAMGQWCQCWCEQSASPSFFCVTVCPVLKSVSVLLTWPAIKHTHALWAKIYTHSSRCCSPHLLKFLSVIRTTQLFFRRQRGKEGWRGRQWSTYSHFAFFFYISQVMIDSCFFKATQVSYKTAESGKREREGLCMCRDVCVFLAVFERVQLVSCTYNIGWCSRFQNSDASTWALPSRNKQHF